MVDNEGPFGGHSQQQQWGWNDRNGKGSWDNSNTYQNNYSDGYWPKGKGQGYSGYKGNQQPANIYVGTSPESQQATAPTSATSTTPTTSTPPATTAP
eukprot:10119835-Alexandrium_andersonii.AAC.1